MIIDGYDTDNDAHKTSNYNEWKAKHNVITEVIVNLERFVVSHDTVKQLLKAIYEKKDFVLYCHKSYIFFCTDFLGSIQGGVVTHYKDLNQFVNVIKLVMITHTKLYVVEYEIENKKMIEE